MRAPSLRRPRPSLRLKPLRRPRPSLRLKLTCAYAAAMAVLLAALGVFVYGRFQAGLDQSLDQSLRSRTNDVQALVTQADTGLADAGRRSLISVGEGFAQVVQTNGAVVDQTPGLPQRALLGAGEIARAVDRPLLLNRARLAGVDGSVRLLATPVQAQGRRLVVIVGTSLQSASTSLRDLRALMLLGGPVALLMASLLGYALSALSLRGVEAMRRRAGVLSLTEPGGRLPVPAARDELHRLAVTLNEMLARNEAAFARESRFVADASHELRSPLAVLKTELEVALTGASSERELRAALVSADAEADRVSHLAADLLTLAQGDHGELRVEPASFPVKQAVDRIRQRFCQRAREDGRMIVASVPEHLVLYADPLRIEQALSNLVDNALRHGAGTVTLLADRQGELVEIHVADNGPGFPPEFLNVAFERFTRPDDGRHGEGTGLGLAIVHSIARSHGGRAHAANRLGGGADVWISLPQAVAWARHGAHQPGSARPQPRAPTTPRSEPEKSKL